MASKASDGLDSQQIELVARAALEAELVRQGFEVARPNRDKGIDLIVYLDEPEHPFRSLPLQMKASSRQGFGVWRKYEHMSGLVIAYVWDVMEAPRFFLLTFREAADLVSVHHQTLSWTRQDGKAGWRYNSAPPELRDKLERYEGRWSWLREQLSLGRPSDRDLRPAAQRQQSADRALALLAEALCKLAPNLTPSKDEAWVRPPAIRVLDCVLSLNRNYDRFVVPRLKAFQQAFPSIRTISELDQEIRRFPSADAFVRSSLDYRDSRRAEIIAQVVSWLAAKIGPASEEEELALLGAWAAEASPSDYERLGIKGFALAGFQYLRMLFGGNTTKPDVPIRQWVEGVIGHPVSVPETLLLLEAAAEAAGVRLRDADTYIWELSARGGGTPSSATTAPLQA